MLITTGQDLRAARDHLRLTQRQLADAIDYRAETVSRWENDAEPIPKVARVAVAGMVGSLTATEAQTLIGAVRTCKPFDGDGDILRKLRAMAEVRP